MVALYMTWIILLIFVAVLYKYGKKDFTSPAFFLALSFFASFTVVMLNIKNWDIEIYGYNWSTTFCILAAIISFAIGSMIVASRSDRNNVNKATVHWQIETRSANYPYVFFAVLSIIMFLLFLKFKIRNISLSSLLSFTNALRDNYTSEKEYSFLTSQILEALVGVAYISLHRVMLEKFYVRKKVNKNLFIPILLFLFGTLLYTDRNIFLRFMIFGLTAFVMSFNWEGVTTRNNRKLIVRVAAAVLAIAVVFWLYGHLKEYTSDFERMVGIYAGSGIYGFNLWLQDFNNQFTNGELTFSSILNTLSAFGIGQGTSLSQRFEMMVYQSRNDYVFVTNIFSALRIYYQDFGILGIIAVSFPMGMIFEKLYQAAIKRKFGFWWLFYCSHIYHILYFPILEQFLLRFHLGIIYEIFWLCFFYYLVYGTNGLWRIRMKENYGRCNKKGKITKGKCCTKCYKTM